MGRHATYLQPYWQLQGSGELAISALANRISVLLVLCGEFALSRDGQTAIMHVNVDILLPEAWKLEAGCNYILLNIFVQVHAVQS